MGILLRWREASGPGGDVTDQHNADGGEREMEKEKTGYGTGDGQGPSSEISAQAGATRGWSSTSSVGLPQ